MVKLKSGSIRFTNYFKQLVVPFKIYVDFACLLKGVRSSDKNNTSYTEKFQDHIPFRSTYKVVLIINSVKKLFFTEEKMEFIDSLKQFLKSMII